MKFDRVKWELYRQKIDDIDARWHAFKKRQMKISWWLHIKMRHYMCRKAKFNFDEHMRITVKNAREKLLVFRIGFHWQRYMRRKREKIEDRKMLLVKNTLNILNFFMEDRAHKRARSVLF